MTDGGGRRTEDIRDNPRLDHWDLLRLNFIRSPGRFMFRRHYRAGLRSHIMAVLRPEDVEKEEKGIERDGLRWFPKARPLKMLRIFRTRFASLDHALRELSRVKVVETYLAPGYMAISNEFLVDYRINGEYETLLCGLQEYVEGEILDPWGPLDRDFLRALYRRMAERGKRQVVLEEDRISKWVETVRGSVGKALTRIRKMIRETSLIPDLAGVGNLLLTSAGGLNRSS